MAKPPRISRMSSNSLLMVFLSLKVIYAISVDCPNVIQFAYNLGLQTASPTIWSLIQVDCCSFPGVKCDGNQRVYQINFFQLGLNGTINGTAIPSTVTYLSLSNNYLLTGSIPLTLPAGLTHFLAYRNRLNGTIPKVLPNGLIVLNVHINKLIGNIPLQLPAGLKTLELYNNQLSGDLPQFPSTLENIRLGVSGYPGNCFSGTLNLNRPILLSINYNWITDVVIQDSSVLETGSVLCDLSNNPLLGNPNVARLTNCTKNGLYSADLLPKTHSTLSFPQTLMLNSVIQRVASTMIIISTTPSSTNNDFSTVTAMSYTFVPLGHNWDSLNQTKVFLKLLVEVVALVFIICNTPWKREFKNKMINWKKGKGKDNLQ